VIVVGNPHRAPDLDCLASLRSALPATWIIVIDTHAMPGEGGTTASYYADAVIAKSFSLDDLLRRLAAFSHRPRPP
jgi:hypothetical protein